MRRRELLRAAVLGTAGLGAGALVGGCGDAAGPGDRGGNGGGAAVAAQNVARATADTGALAGAATAVRGLSGDLYRRMAAANAGNLVCSPYSVAVALGMTRAGAAGRTASEMDAVLHASALGSGPDALPAGLNALTLAVESRAGKRTLADGSTIEILVDVANSLWGQRQTPWEAPFLETLARYYGAGMRTIDFGADAAGATRAINDWTAKQTHDRIPTLLSPTDLDASTRLVLVNALYLRAPWQIPFGDARPAPFTRPDGSAVQARLMSLTLAQAGYATGPGWRAVDIPYAGGELAMAVVLPDPGRLDAIEAALDETALRGLLTGFQPTAVELELPRWTFRTHAGLGDPLAALGMPTAFGGDADFSGMTRAEKLHIDKVVHEAFIAVDEQGTEAAAATAVAMAVSAILTEVRLTVDRPFLFVVHDRATATPLFVGRVVDPTAA
ncbi:MULTISPECIES: serpin family protein [unclassified Pseudofrankia]|uniref:serpin family protein n=1 Tax=unclassified Pseudofrankia TaxID=2994372 RepID=UPI0009F51784|nr:MULTISPECIES: serpin family protein [unclassified Pseudofrankia]MDT3442389.1 serpin family protein [Pseudofrankia sp. BMG5.37]